MNQPKEKKRLLYSSDDLYPLERLRKERTNLTQSDFTAQIGLCNRTYQKWIERGVPPKLAFGQLRKMRECLGITQDELEALFDE